jgi:hypothetical protein
MRNARVLYAMVRADFLERVRRYSFLLTLAFAVYLGYAVLTGKIVLRLDAYRGIYNSAWLGVLMGMIASTFLSLVGFYIVKNAIQRDQDTRVGVVLATTPMSKSFYTVAKTISNFAVLAAMVLVMGVAAILMQLLRAEDPHIHLWALLAPLLVIAMPAMFFTGAMAVLFETLPVLRGGAGNVIYFFVWTALLVVGGTSSLDQGTKLTDRQFFADFSGLISQASAMQAALRQIDPQYKNGVALNIGDKPPTKRFLYEGLHWNSAMYLSRLVWILLALGVALLASLFFHRFDPARGWVLGKMRKKDAEEAGGSPAVIAFPREKPTAVHLTPIQNTERKTRFAHLVISELRLMLKGQRWWWYAAALGLFIGGLASPLDDSRQGWLTAAWLWPILLWSQMGCREARFGTGSLIFSAQNPLRRQLPAIWTAGVVVAVLTGGGAGLRMLMAGDHTGLKAWAAGALFIPSLALALGVWSGSGKMFEALYTAWWYVGPLHHTPALDFAGTTDLSSSAAWYLGFAMILLAAAWSGRRAKLAYA